MSNLTLANAAIGALTRDGFESEKGYCQRFVRQVIQSSLGSKYDVYFKASAKETGLAFLKAWIGFPATELAKHGGLQEGDVLYKTEGSGGFGHVGIYTSKGVAENSSYHAKNDNDARGLRSLKQFGVFQVVVRLEDPHAPTEKVPAPALCLLDSIALPVLLDDADRPYVQVAALVAAQKRVVVATTNRMDEDPPRFYVNTKAK